MSRVSLVLLITFASIIDIALSQSRAFSLLQLTPVVALMFWLGFNERYWVKFLVLSFVSCVYGIFLNYNLGLLLLSFCLWQGALFILEYTPVPIRTNFFLQISGFFQVWWLCLSIDNFSFDLIRVLLGVVINTLLVWLWWRVWQNLGPREKNQKIRLY